MRVRDVPLVGWVSYVPLSAVLGGLIAVVCGFGAALGAPSLIWHDDGWTQLSAGVAAAALCAHLGMVGYLLDSRENPDAAAVAPGAAMFGSVARYLMWPVGALAVTVGAAFWGPAARRAIHGAGVVPSWALLAAAAALPPCARGRQRLPARAPLAARYPARLRAGAHGRCRAPACARLASPAPPRRPRARAVQGRRRHGRAQRHLRRHLRR